MSAAVVLALLLAACNDGQVSRRIGVSGSAQGGDVTIHFVVCDEERSAQSVTVFQVVGDMVADGDDEILWRVVADAPNHVEKFVVGEVPPGFQEEVALAEPLPSNESLSARVEFRDELEALIGFELGELPNNEILSQKGPLSHGEFDDYAQDTCPS